MPTNRVLWFMADSILRLKVESQEYDNKLKQATNGLTRYADECRKVGGTLEVVEKETLDYVRALGQMDTTSRTATGKLAEMKKTFTELSVVYKNMTDEEKNSPFGKALATSLDQLKGRIGESKVQLDDINKSINGGGGLTGALDSLSDKFGMSVQSLAGWGTALAAGKAALDVVKDAFFQSESNIDEWGRTLEGAKGAYEVFLNALNTGNWSNFFNNLSKAIQGGRDLYDALDRLGSVKANNQAAIAIAQAEIQRLRVLKQQGQNVDDQIKATTQRLKELQGQQVRAGKNAGRTEIINTLRNEVAGRNTTGVQVTDSQLRAAANRAIKEGDDYFKGMANLVRKYENDSRYQTKSTGIVQTGTIAGGTREVTVTSFDLSKLSQEAQRQYLIAKAITEGESRVQQGISTFAQAVTEGGQSYRDEFRGNRYAASGSGGSGSGSQKEFTSKMDFPELGTATLSTTESMKELQAQLAAYKQQLASATNILEYGEAQQGIEQTQKRIGALPIALKAGIDIDTAMAVQEQWEGGLREQIEDALKADAIRLKASLEIDPERLKEVSTDAKNIGDSWRVAGSAIQTVGAALGQIEDPAAKVVGTIAQAIATITLSFASSMKGSVTPWDWIAAAVAGTATLVSTIKTIKSATNGGFAEGGIVPGNSYSGDLLRTSDYGINSGELILNRSQQDNIASQLEGNSSQQMDWKPYVTGEVMVLGVNNHLKRTGQGEIVTTKMLQKIGIV